MASKTGTLVKVQNEWRLTRGVRMTKMVAAACPFRGSIDGHQPDAETTGFWVEQCIADGHDPFTTTKEVEVVKPEYEERDGRKFKTGELIEIELVTHPNLEQVYAELKGYSGRGVQAAVEMGWKFPEELGYAPFCEYLNCWNQNPKFRTNVGIYCNRDQAALMVLVTGNDPRSDVGTPTYLTFGEDEANFRRQLAGVNLDGTGRETGGVH